MNDINNNNTYSFSDRVYRNLQESEIYRRHCLNNECKKNSHCKVCNGFKNETINRWLINHRNKDRAVGLLTDNFIDKPFLIKLVIDSYDLCYYCSNPVQYVEKNYTLASIDRIDDNIGHEKTNVVLCCLHCNLGRSRINGHLQYQHKHKYYHICRWLVDNFDIL